MSDDDMIRRGDALAAVTDTSVKWGFTGEPAILIDTKAAIRALPAHVQPATVEVKPLEWVEHGTDFWRVQGIDRVYEVIAMHDGRFFLTNGPRLCDFPTLESAQAAAQADHSARILSAVNLRPVADVQAVAVAGAVAQMREALRMLGVIPGKVWMMLEEIDSDAAQEALDRIRAEAREKALREAAERIKGLLGGKSCGEVILTLIKEPTHD